MATKQITKGHEARLKIKKGIDIAADAVRPTLGPVGMTAFIEFPGLDPIECDDGVTILKNIELADHYEQMGVLSLRKGALRTSTEGGDGTATTTVLTQALIHEAFKEIKDSSRIAIVRQRLADGLEVAINHLKGYKREVDVSEIESIAAVSSLDPEVATLIADVIKEVGVDGVVTVEKNPKLGYSKEVVKGMRFDRGWISPYFVNSENGKSILENAFVVLVDRKVSMNEQILPILNSIGVGTNILFIADDVDSVALGSLAQNAINGIAKITVVKNPYTGQQSREFLQDVAALTGATIISEENGMRLSEATKELCGRVGRVIATKDQTIISGAADSEGLQMRIQAIKNSIDEATSEYQRGMLEDRLAALTGGIGVIRVGAYTDTEYNAKKYKFENAINATQAALQEGILPGGGFALAKIASLMKDPIFQNALKAPMRQMAVNAGMFDKKRFGKPSVEKTVEYALKKNVGIDFAQKRYTSMLEAGIIDPFKVVRLALESAVAITRATVGMETAIVIQEDKK